MGPVYMTLLFFGTLGFFAWSAARRWRQLTVGVPEPRFTLADGELMGRIRDTVVYAFGQLKMPKYRLAGVAHIMIFVGFQVLTIRSLMLAARGYDPYFDFWGILGQESLLGQLYGFAKDTVIAMVLAGVGAFVYLRAVVKSQRMTLSTEGLVILGIIGTMMIADAVYDGAWFVLQSRVTGEPLHLHAEWLGSSLSFLFQGLDESLLTVMAHAGFWVHIALVLIFLNILPFSKHFHIITAIPNVFVRDRTPRGALPNVEDLEGKVERDEPIGISKVTDLSWAQILDLYTCTECGRCSDNCPAYTTDKKLSPKHLTLALRDNLYDAEAALTGEEPFEWANANPPIGEKEEIHTFPKPPADAYFRAEQGIELIPGIINPDVIWGCTTCGACEEQCPVMISYVDKIVGMRRDQVMMQGEMPAELQRPFMGMETNGNPWNQSAMDRGNWADGEEIPLIADHPDAAVLYWVGCAASYDMRAQKTAKSMAKLLKKAEVDFAILGSEETCTGDPARRAGNEYLFQMLAEQNVETMNGYGVGKKTIVTTCPHCFNTLANEYPDFGGKFDVVHHTEFLNGLIARGKLVPEKSVQAKVAFHDSCYLGRYNNVYESPREVLSSIPGVELVEVENANRSKGLCCGAGGAQMWMEEQNENRVNKKRTLQLLDTGADTVASGCPFCMTMLTDGLKAYEKEEEIAQLDVVELLSQSVL